MKNVLFFLLFSSSIVWAQNSCPNLQGTYKKSSREALSIVQNACFSLARQSGSILADGSVAWDLTKQKMTLDGEPSCIYGRCISAQADGDTILFTLNYTEVTSVPGHGICSYRSYTFERNGEGLRARYNAIDCDSGFSGAFEKYFPHL